MKISLTDCNSPYQINGENATQKDFTAVACNPARSVAVEACAGSGKTWLLVSRMLRQLLAGAQPSELLAITFTRKAAQEMRDRLMHLLMDLAVSSEDVVRDLLLERGIAESQVRANMPVARGLYARVLSSSQPLSIDTFHSWFAKILKIAPLSSGVPHGYSLSESSSEMMTEAYTRFMASLSKEENYLVKSAMISLYDLVGDSNAKLIMDAFVSKRAEWWAMTQDGNAELPLQALVELCGVDAKLDPRMAVWDNAELMDSIRKMAQVLSDGSKRNIDRAAAIQNALAMPRSLESFDCLSAQFVDDKGAPKGNDHRRGAMLKATELHFGSGGSDIFEAAFHAIAAEMHGIQRRSFEPKVMAINEAVYTAGAAYLAVYQSVKEEQTTFDFGDLEWHAYRLLSNEVNASYLLSRLDSRYKHVLLDEFQDTNMMQWHIVRAWLDAYGDDSSKPSVFIVGDPKQSIYRFRRSDPRVFNAAIDMLREQNADVLRTSQTRRNSSAVVEFLNDTNKYNPLYTVQSTDSEQDGEVWRLPLARVDDEPGQKASSEEFSIRDPLTTPRADREDERRYVEGVGVAQALLQARKKYNVKWSDVMLLVKKRKHLGSYESALRAHGIPFVSDKRGGLLESLEVSDMVALMRFLVTPRDDLSLAQVLKSPMFGASDNDLIMLATGVAETWWQRLLASTEQCSDELYTAANTLSRWLAVAPKLPVHDLIDLILSEGGLAEKYAANAPAVLRTQVLGNLEAFVEMSLNLDAGRYPSLSRFIDTLVALQNGDGDAPNEAGVDDATDAVRIMTIHGAKGLEAKVVVVLDANHTDGMREDYGILCEWNKETSAPTHFSIFGKNSERGAARDPLFMEEAMLKEQEDWNMLYVAITRTKALFICSGVAGTRGADVDGSMPSSWYSRMRSVPETVFDEVLPPEVPIDDAGEFEVSIFSPGTYPNKSVEEDEIDRLMAEF